MENWQVAVNSSCVLGEGPVWDRNKECLYWVDITQCVIHQFFPEINEWNTFQTEHIISALALRESGGLVAATQKGLYFVDLSSTNFSLIEDPEQHISDNRFNDGKCDAAGRFWAGTMNMAGRLNAGSLYMLDAAQQVSLKITDISCSNGIAWNKDNTAFYHIDTSIRELASYAFDLPSGTLSNKKVIAVFPKEEGLPDGMTIDNEGMLWIAFWNGWKVARVNPSTGKIIDEIRLPASRVTSCTFGGESMEDMYITTARIGLSEEDMAHQPLAGSLFVVKKCGFKGIDTFAYTG